MCLYIFVYLNMILKNEISIQLCKLGNVMNANKVYPWMLMRKCLLAMLILKLVILMLILMLLNLNTGYADTDADLCIKIMSLCCIIIFLYSKSPKSGVCKTKRASMGKCVFKKSYKCTSSDVWVVFPISNTIGFCPLFLRFCPSVNLLTFLSVFYKL